MVSIVFRAELTAVAEPAACHSPKREPRGLAGLMAPVRFADTVLHGRVDIERSPLTHSSTRRCSSEIASWSWCDQLNAFNNIYARA